MPDKLTFRRPPRNKLTSGTQVIRVSYTSYNAIEEISAKTGLSNSFIASKMLEFAIEHTEVLESE